MVVLFFFQAEDGIRDLVRSRGLGDVYKRQGRYSSSGDCGAQVREFKAMVKALHRAGIEVILDVVYNLSLIHI